MIQVASRPTEAATNTSWQELADRVFGGHELTTDEALAILRAPDEQLLDLLAAAYRIRRRYFGNTVQLYFLMNAKSGLCPEDCGYCSQSKVSEAEIPRYNLLSRDKLLDGAARPPSGRRKTYCIVISARGPNEREMRPSRRSCPEIKAQVRPGNLRLPGPAHARPGPAAAACGVDKVNHNLNTSGEHYDEICTTHTYQDRVDTLQAVPRRRHGAVLRRHHRHGRAARATSCRMAFELRELGVESIPVNFLNPIDGTPLAGPVAARRPATA